MKILLVNKFHWRKGGSETYYFALADGLRALGHEVAFFSMEDERNEPTEWSRYFVTNRDYNGPSSIVDKAKAAQALVYSKEAREKFDALCREFQPDVIHLNLTHRQITFSILDAPWLKQHPTPVVYTSHDLILACPSYLMLDSEGNVCDSCLGGHFGNCLKKKCVKGSIAKSALAVAEAEWLKRHKTYSRLDRIICPSEFMRNKFIEAGLPERQLVLMRNFLNPDSMSREVANQNNEDPYMLYLGRLSREKGVLTLVHAFENAPYAVLEALVAGKPVIGTNMGGIPELVREGETGFLAEAHDEAGLADAIRRGAAVAADSAAYAAMSAHCRSFVAENCNQEKYILYQELIDRKVVA